MARTATLEELRDRAYARGDFAAQTDRFSTTEVNGYINDSIAAFQDLLIQAWGSWFFEADYDFTTSADDSTYPVPGGFYLVSLVQVNTGTRFRKLRPSGREQRSALTDTNASLSGFPSFYALRGDNIILMPTPSSAMPVHIEYVPAATVLDSDSDTMDGVNGWEEWVVNDVARKMAVKDNATTQIAVLKDELAVIEQRIRIMAPKRDRGERRVVDVLRGRRIR